MSTDKGSVADDCVSDSQIQILNFEFPIFIALRIEWRRHRGPTHGPGSQPAAGHLAH